MLATVLDPAHRTAQVHGQPGHHGVLGVDMQLAAEAATDIAGHDADAMLRQPQDARQDGALDVGDLGRGPDREPVVAVLGHDRSRLERHRRVPTHAVLAADDAGALEQLVEAGVGRRHRDDDVVGPSAKRRGASAARAASMSVHDRQLLVVDRDRLRGVLREVAIGRYDGGHRRAHVADALMGEERWFTGRVRGCRSGMAEM